MFILLSFRSSCVLFFFVLMRESCKLVYCKFAIDQILFGMRIPNNIFESYDGQMHPVNVRNSFETPDRQVIFFFCRQSPSHLCCSHFFSGGFIVAATAYELSVIVPNIGCTPSTMSAFKHCIVEFSLSFAVIPIVRMYDSVRCIRIDRQ